MEVETPFPTSLLWELAYSQTISPYYLSGQAALQISFAPYSLSSYELAIAGRHLI
jgi:hypothetical protein